jgi:predicted polyphosphate/ATP-dependent NAD kinase
VRIGLVVNPIAGLGGRVGLKGTDGAEVVARALALGAVPVAGARAARALARLRSDAPAGSSEVLVAPGPMGEEPARAAGLPCTVVGETAVEPTSAEDTRRIARSLVEDHDVDVLLFAGGDGTATDVLAAVGTAVPVVGIPAGVKIHSGVFAVTPEAAGTLAAMFARRAAVGVAEAEVLDLDEDAYRRGEIAPRLVGYLRVPQQRRLVQARKSATPAGEEAAARAIAVDVVEGMEAGRAYVLGPGTTVRAIAERLGVPKTLVGVDAVRDGRLVVADGAEADLLALLAEGPVSIVVTPIGGQGFLFGRGNQQIGPALLRAAGRRHILVVATPWKLASLGAQPLRVDTGDPQTDAWLAGHLRVITGYRDRAIRRVEH